ncbi:MAG: hypothetical protein JKY65_26625 [Planctomycetes bacterium]|nr:hypothetical protein [Planctomycetota bacterium]
MSQAQSTLELLHKSPAGGARSRPVYRPRSRAEVWASRHRENGLEALGDGEDQDPNLVRLRAEGEALVLRVADSTTRARFRVELAMAAAAEQLAKVLDRLRLHLGLAS